MSALVQKISSELTFRGKSSVLHIVPCTLHELKINLQIEMIVQKMSVFLSSLIDIEVYLRSMDWSHYATKKLLFVWIFLQKFVSRSTNKILPEGFGRTNSFSPYAGEKEGRKIEFLSF